MINLFTYDFNAEEKFNAKAYLNKLKEATKNNKLYIARNIDYNDGLYNEVASSEQDANAVTVVNIEWDNYDVYKLLFKYDQLIEEIKKNKGRTDIFETNVLSSFNATKRFLFSREQSRKEHEKVMQGIAAGDLSLSPAYPSPPLACDKLFKNRIDRLSKLLSINAPQAVIENEKRSLLEVMAFYYCADRYHDIKLDNDNPAVEQIKGRVDVENEKFVALFLELYQDMAQFIKDNVEVTFADIQKHFKIGYSFMIYALDMLEDNCLVVEWQGKFKDTGLSLNEASALVINTKPFKREDKFLDEMKNEK